MKSSIGLFYQITVTDKNGKVVSKTRLRRSKSFLLQFLQLLEVHMKQVGVTINDITNTPSEIGVHSSTFRIAAGIGIVNMGIIIGTGTTPPTNADYVVETIIGHGSGAGQINYAAHSFVTTQEVGANVDFQHLRSMQNLSGGTINVTEAVIYANATAKYLCIVRDVFTAVPVADGQTITVTYTLRTTV